MEWYGWLLLVVVLILIWAVLRFSGGLILIVDYFTRGKYTNQDKAGKLESHGDISKDIAEKKKQIAKLDNLSDVSDAPVAPVSREEMIKALTYELKTSHLKVESVMLDIELDCKIKEKEEELRLEKLELKILEAARDSKEDERDKLLRELAPSNEEKAKALKVKLNLS